jgi:crossover junction endodeoxyribonuclease RuvC
MFDEMVLGIDPGVASIGLAAVSRGTSRPTVAWAATFRTPADLDTGARLRRIYGAVRTAIAERGAGVVALERLLWGRNTGSAMGVARASGVIMLAAADASVRVEEYAPLEVKMAVTGVGNASKAQVRRALGLVLGPNSVPSQPDAADAVAVALCHLQQSRLRAMTTGAVR